MSVLVAIVAVGLTAAACGEGTGGAVKPYEPDAELIDVAVGECVWVREDTFGYTYMQSVPCDGPYANYVVRSIVEGKLAESAGCDAVVEEWTDGGIRGFDPVLQGPAPNHPVEVSYCLRDM